MFPSPGNPIICIRGAWWRLRPTPSRNSSTCGPLSAGSVRSWKCWTRASLKSAPRVKSIPPMGAGYPCSGWRRCRPISTCGTRCFPRQCAATSLTNTMPFRIGKPCCIPRTARSRACSPSRRSVWARAACWPCANRAACAGSRPAPSGPGRSTRLTIFRAIPRHCPGTGGAPPRRAA